jgi:hypothetical protein
MVCVVVWVAGSREGSLRGVRSETFLPGAIAHRNRSKAKGRADDADNRHLEGLGASEPDWAFAGGGSYTGAFRVSWTSRNRAVLRLKLISGRLR